MVDPRFYECVGAFTLERLAEVGQAELIKPPSILSNEEAVFKDVAPLEEAQPSDLSLFHNLKYKEAFQKSKAGACFIHASAIEFAPKDMALLVSPSPQRSFGLALTTLFPHAEGKAAPMSSPIHPTAKIGEHTTIEYGAVIKERAKIGKYCHIGANSVIGTGVEIGDHTWIGQNVTISHALIGERVMIYPGARIGQAGFGFAMDKEGFVTVPQLGRVLIEDDVQIGANTTIDRGSLRDTIIGQGSRLDNLIMIAHNVVLGRGCVLVAQVGIAGSTQLGNYVIAAGQAGIIGHLNIEEGARIGAQAGVMRDIKAGETVLGSPAVPIKDFMRQTAVLQRLAKRPSKERNKMRE
jgi:UDP-3-O-[3-hydroxymyristoyl] glucosamine N-acyltransferase